jgi:hypothetical protein
MELIFLLIRLHLSVQLLLWNFKVFLDTKNMNVLLDMSISCLKHLNTFLCYYLMIFSHTQIKAFKLSYNLSIAKNLLK